MLKVGVCGFARARRGFAQNIRAAELEETARARVRPAVMARWKAEAPSWFDFVPTAPTELTSPVGSSTLARAFWPTGPALELWGRICDAVEVLRASAVLVTTPNTFRPSVQNRRAMAAFFERCPRANLKVVWRSKGLWSGPEVANICADLNLWPCMDLVSGRVADLLEWTFDQQWTYCRVDPLRSSGRVMDADDLRLLAQVCSTVSDGYCILNTERSVHDAIRLSEVVRRNTHVPELG